MDPALIALELKEWIVAEHQGHGLDRSPAYWALGKRCDSELIPFFRDRLRLEVERDMNAAYQIMIALQDLDEPAFGQNRAGYSSTEHDLNRQDAVRYLNAMSSDQRPEGQ